MVMKGGQIIDISLKPDEQSASRFLTPIVGVENGLQLDYDRNKERIFWVEAIAKDSENVCTVCLHESEKYSPTELLLT